MAVRQIDGGSVGGQKVPVDRFAGMQVQKPFEQFVCDAGRRSLAWSEVGGGVIGAAASEAFAEIAGLIREPRRGWRSRTGPSLDVAFVLETKCSYQGRPIGVASSLIQSSGLRER